MCTYCKNGLLLHSDNIVGTIVPALWNSVQYAGFSLPVAGTLQNTEPLL